MADRIAIDFGTTRTKVAWRPDGAARPELLRFGDRYRPFAPSLFYLPADGGAPLFGDDAEERLADEPGAVIDVVKRRRRDAVLRAGNGRTIAFADLLTALLAWLRGEAAAAAAPSGGGAPTEAVLTLPVAFGEADRAIWIDAAKAAGFDHAQVLDEPVAAAMAWLSESGETANDVIVLDCGGGTVDWAWVRREGSGGGFAVSAAVPPEGIGDVGGHDVDLGLLDLVERRRDRDGPEDEVGRVSAARLLAMVRRAKEAACRNETPQPITLGRTQVRLSKADIDTVIAERLHARTLPAFGAFVDRVAVANGGAAPPLLLVGGGAPLLASALASETTGSRIVGWDGAAFAPALGALLDPTTRAPAVVTVGNDGAGMAASVAEALTMVAEGGRIELLPGMYEVLSLIMINRDVEIVGRDGAKATTLIGWGFIRVTAGQAKLCGLTFRQVRDDDDKIPGVIADEGAGLDVEDCIFTGQAGISCDEGASLRVTGSSFIGITHAVIAQEDVDPVITGNRFSGCSGWGVLVSRGGARVADNVMEDCDPGVAVGEGAEPLVENNRISGGSGLLVYDGGAPTVRANRFAGCRNGVAMVGGSRATIERNRFEANVTAVKFAGSGLDFTGNDVIGGDTGVHAIDGSGVRIAENRFDGCVEQALYLTRTDAEITGNQIADIPDAGIAIEGGTIAICGNRIERAKRGIMLFSDASGSIRDNRIVDVVSTGISLHGSPAELINNEISGSEATGIALLGATGLIERNRLSSLECGMMLTDGAAPTIRANKIADTQLGIMLIENSRGVIDGNDIGPQERSGIAVTAGSAPIIRNNRIHDGQVGIEFRASGRASVSANIFVNCSITEMTERDGADMRDVHF